MLSKRFIVFVLYTPCFEEKRNTSINFCNLSLYNPNISSNSHWLLSRWSSLRNWGWNHPSSSTTPWTWTSWCIKLVVKGERSSWRLKGSSANIYWYNICFNCVLEYAQHVQDTIQPTGNVFKGILYNKTFNMLFTSFSWRKTRHNHSSIVYTSDTILNTNLYCTYLFSLIPPTSVPLLFSLWIDSKRFLHSIGHPCGYDWQMRLNLSWHHQCLWPAHTSNKNKILVGKKNLGDPREYFLMSSYLLRCKGK